MECRFCLFIFLHYEVFIERRLKGKTCMATMLCVISATEIVVQNILKG